ncbi:MAG TPA: serine/threonine-protein kinase, partial [Candidatus Angelobacter sp.]|nr:serine/threonine-protein kinase [Candidatus Angelobacter sp.]
MKFLPDQIVARLQTEMQTPDLSGTRYRALKLLGHGGMGTIWLAEDSVLHRMVALKVLSAESSSADLASRLMQEAVILARLEHPGIVPVHDAGTLPDGRTFYCMKYVEGQTLNQHIARLDLRQRLQLLQRIAEPLAFAHSRGIIHRDLKPGNVMVGAFGEVLIMDWGLAKVMSVAEKSFPAGTDAASTEATSTAHSSLRPAPATPASSATTAHGTVLGTPGYMAPEQERGEIHLIDQRTDVFGLGALLQYMLRDRSRNQPKDGTTESVPRPLRAICQRAMANEMSARYVSVQEMAADIGKYLDGMPITAYQENIFERTVRLLSRNRVAVALILAYLFMRMLFILFS